MPLTSGYCGCFNCSVLYIG